MRELVEMAPEPKPHFNTLSTMVRALEAKGYLSHKAFGGTYQYFPIVSESEFSRRTLGNVISRYFENSYTGGCFGFGRGGEDFGRGVARIARPHQQNER